MSIHIHIKLVFPGSYQENGDELRINLELCDTVSQTGVANSRSLAKVMLPVLLVFLPGSRISSLPLAILRDSAAILKHL